MGFEAFVRNGCSCALAYCQQRSFDVSLTLSRQLQQVEPPRRLVAEVQAALWKAAGLNPSCKLSGVVTGHRASRLFNHATWREFTGLPPMQRGAASSRRGAKCDTHCPLANLPHARSGRLAWRLSSALPPSHVSSTIDSHGQRHRPSARLPSTTRTTGCTRRGAVGRLPLS